MNLYVVYVCGVDMHAVLRIWQLPVAQTHVLSSLYNNNNNNKHRMCGASVHGDVLYLIIIYHVYYCEFCDICILIRWLWSSVHPSISLINALSSTTLVIGNDDVGPYTPT